MPEGRSLEGGRVGLDGSRPALGRDAEDAGSCEGREPAALEGRDTLPVDGRLVGRELELIPLEGRETLERDGV